MSFILVLGAALALALDAFAVTVGASVAARDWRWKNSLRMASAFGFFQFAMPLLGNMAGSKLVDSIGKYDHWAAAGLLFLVGGRMIIDSLRPESLEEKKKRDPSRGLTLLLLAMATSLDALAVGLSLAALRTAILTPAIVIGIVAFLMTLLAGSIGPRFGRLLGRRAELGGGVVLIVIAVRILATHL